jgi:hypothetical protein
MMYLLKLIRQVKFNVKINNLKAFYYVYSQIYTMLKNKALYKYYKKSTLHLHTVSN